MIVPSSIRNFRKSFTPELYQKLRIDPILFGLADGQMKVEY